jgi:DNA gyrase subunit A
MLEDEMRRSYLDYAMSVIVARALPDARDGLKPVHRRILFAMQESGFTPDKPYRKSARITGDVMGKYHPHGDASIYDALVRMAQSFSMRVRLIDGQGNFGSVDGDPPAAMRYTESRLATAAMFLLNDIDRDTVDFQPNYDESAEEPKVLPASFPNLLVNGANGIAVGMATNIPPHNPTEIIDATLAMIANPDLTLEELMAIVPGPDFPTGAIILGRAGIRQAFETGRGSIILRARTEFEEIRRDRTAIIVTEIPYQVNKATLLERIADLVRNKQVEGISDMRDESDRSGMRIVVELKRDATPEVVLNQLFRFTQLQTSFGVNMLALDNGRPRQMGIREALTCFITFREEVILRRARHDLARARDRGHLLVGLAIAVANIDEVIRLIRAAPDAAAARTALMERDWPAEDVLPLLALIEDRGNIVGDTSRVRLTEAQARGILDLRLQRLTGLERSKIQAELTEVAEKIKDLLDILASRVRRLEVMRDELAVVRAEIGTKRLTEIADAAADQDDESLIEPGQMVVTITRDNFIKRTPLETFRQQNRGGRGRTAATTRGDDVVTRSFNAHTHQWVLFFSSGGQAYREKVWRLPEAESLWENLHLVFATAAGNVRRNKLSDFRNMRTSGLIAMKLDEGDHLIGVATCRDGDDMMLATERGRCIRFQIHEDNLRVFAGRDSAGVRGIRLAAGDRVIGLSVLRHVEATPDERAAYLKRSRAGDAEAVAEVEAEPDATNAEFVLPEDKFRSMADAEQMLLTVTDGGAVVATFPVQPGDDLMLVTTSARLIRVPGDQIRVTGRQAMGVTLVRLGEGETVTSVFPVMEEPTEPEAADTAPSDPPPSDPDGMLR